MNGRYQYDDRRYQYHDIDYYKDEAFDPANDLSDLKKIEGFYDHLKKKNDKAIQAAYGAKKKRNEEEIKQDLRRRYFRTEEERQQFHMRRDEVYQHIMFFRKRFYNGLFALLLSFAVFVCLFTSANISLATAILYATVPMGSVMFFFLFHKQTEYGLYDERISASTLGKGFIRILLLLILVLALYVVHAVFLGGKALMGLDILNILDTLLKPLQDIILGLF